MKLVTQQVRAFRGVVLQVASQSDTTRRGASAERASHLMRGRPSVELACAGATNGDEFKVLEHSMALAILRTLRSSTSSALGKISAPSPPRHSPRLRVPKAAGLAMAAGLAAALIGCSLAMPSTVVVIIVRHPKPSPRSRLPFLGDHPQCICACGVLPVAPQRSVVRLRLQRVGIQS